MIIDAEGVKTETIEHNGMEFLYCSNKGAQYLLWLENDYALLLVSELPKEELLRIVLNKPPQYTALQLYIGTVLLT